MAAPPQLIDSGRSFVASDTTSALVPEDINGLSTTVTLPASGYIAAFLSLTSSVDGNNKSGFWLIDIEGVDSPVLARRHSGSGDRGSVGVVFRSGLLGAGTYTVKAEHYTTASVILTSTNVTLVAMCLVDDGGNVIESAYDAITSDSTVSNALEDIDGLTQDIALNGTSYIFATIAASISTSQSNKSYVLAVDTAGDDHTNARSVAPAGDVGNICVIGRPASRVSGTQTVKGQHSISSGTGTAEEAILVAFELAVSDAYEIPSDHAMIQSASTTSASLVNIADLDVDIKLSQEAHILAIMSVDATITTGAVAEFAIEINGADQDVTTRTFSNPNDDGVIYVVARTTAPLPAGNYSIRGRWNTDSGTLSIHTEACLTAISLETAAEYDLTTSTTTSSTTSSSTSSTTSSSTSSTSSTTSLSSTTTSSSSTSSTSSSSTTSTTVTIIPFDAFLAVTRTFNFTAVARTFTFTAKSR